MSHRKAGFFRARCATCIGGLALVAMTFWLARPSQAFPMFARRYNVSCHTCHSIVPKLNETGLAFRELGYRLPEMPTRRTIPFAGGFAGRYENRISDGVDDLFLRLVKVVSGGGIGERASYVVKWHAVDRTLNYDGSLIDRSGVLEDAFVNFDLNKELRLTVGQFRVFNQFDQALQLSGSVPVALGLGVPGEEGETTRQTQLRGFAPVQRSPAVMLSYHLPGERSYAHAADGWYFHGSIPFPGELSVPVNERAERFASFELEGEPKGLFLETYYRRGLSTYGGAAFFDAGRQLYTGMVSIDPGQWATAVAVSGAVLEGEVTRRMSWWGEFRPSYWTNLGLRLDDPGNGSVGTTLYGDYQWFSERAMVWIVLEQQLRSGANRTILQVKTVF